MTEEEILNISNLSDLAENKLDELLSCSEQNKNVILFHVIKYHYAKLDVTSEDYSKLANSYKSSWILEKIYRNNGLVRQNYSPIYVNSGIIRDLVNNMYFTNNDLKMH